MTVVSATVVQQLDRNVLYAQASTYAASHRRRQVNQPSFLRVLLKRTHSNKHNVTLEKSEFEVTGRVKKTVVLDNNKQ